MNNVDEEEGSTIRSLRKYIPISPSKGKVELLSEVQLSPPLMVLNSPFSPPTYIVNGATGSSVRKPELDELGNARAVQVSPPFALDIRTSPPKVVWTAPDEG